MSETSASTTAPTGRGRLLNALGAVGFVATLVGGTLLAALVLLGSAYGFGWFSPAPTADTLEPVELDPVVVRIRKAR